MRHVGTALATALMVAACADPVAPALVPPEQAPLVMPAAPTAPEVFARYVAVGTSNSMGVQSAGISAAAQSASWPAQLAARVAGVTFVQPLVQDPGCSPPLLAPLAANLALLGAFTAFGAGDDLVSAVMTACAPLRAGLTPPLNNVAISGANVHEALFETIASATARSPRLGTLYSRVLAPGQTQVTAMLAQHPTFVSVELAANDVLPASTGHIAAMTTFASWASDYDQVLAAVGSTGARAVLVGLPSDAARFPSLRRAREFFDEWPSLLTLGITVSPSCYVSSNHLYVPGYVLTLLSRAPATATCADVPGAEDYVLTAADVRAVNDRMAQMNAYIQARAAASGYAYFAISAVYDLPKPAFRVHDLLFASAPFGSNISLDGVHLTARGQAILATAAAEAVNARYGLAIP